MKNAPYSNKTGSPAEIIIILAAYNGGAFIEEQIKSIQNQSESTWRLLIRDDGSTDNTLEIAKSLASSDSRIHLINDNLGRLGSTGNFAALLENQALKKAKYIMFSDQDDIWKKEKIASMLHRIRKLEGIYGTNYPILVHSDLEVVDRNLQRINKSFFKHQMIKHEDNHPLNFLLARNFVTGCASIMNYSLAELATPMPKQARRHDHWVALLAAACGKIEFINEATVRYRQHEKNEVGANNYWSQISPFHRNIKYRWDNEVKKLIKDVRLASNLYERLVERDFISRTKSIDLIAGYMRILNLPRISRIIQCRQLGIKRQGAMGQALHYGVLLSIDSTNEKDQ